MLYHVATREVECDCGEIIAGEHVCLKASNHVRESEYNKDSCARCKCYDENVKYDSQWSEDEDGYSICSGCRIKRDHGILPKNCGCDYDRQWSRDWETGDCVCYDCWKKCEYGELPKRCECDIEKRSVAIDIDGDIICFKKEDLD